MADEMAELFGDAARAMAAESGVPPTLEHALAVAHDLLQHCHYAGVTVVKAHRKVVTAAATDPIVERADALQQELDEGPAIQSIVEHETVHSRDLLQDTRWPTWSRRVTEDLGVRSVLCLQLFITEQSIGALSLYSTRVDAFDADDRAAAVIFAAHVAVAMSAAETEHNLDTALVNRLAIGQAEGMLMQRYGMSADQAFAVLVRISQDTNRKLLDVSHQIATEGIDVEKPTS